MLAIADERLGGEERVGRDICRLVLRKRGKLGGVDDN